MIRKSELVARLIRNGLPEAVIFDGVDGLDSLAKVFRGYGIDPKKEVKLISNKEMVDGGIYLQPDYSLFAERCRIDIRIVFSAIAVIPESARSPAAFITSQSKSTILYRRRK